MLIDAYALLKICARAQLNSSSSKKAIAYYGDRPHLFVPEHKRKNSLIECGMFETHITWASPIVMWCYCCHHQHHHYAIGSVISLSMMLQLFFQTKLILKHYDLNVRISISPENKLLIFKKQRKKGRKRRRTAVQTIKQPCFFCSISFFCSVSCGFALWIDSCEAFAYIYHRHHHYCRCVRARNAHTCDIKRIRV